MGLTTGVAWWHDGDMKNTNPKLIGTGTRALGTIVIHSYGNEDDAVEQACLQLETAGLRDLEVDTGADYMDDNTWHVTYTYTRG